MWSHLINLGKWEIQYSCKNRLIFQIILTKIFYINLKGKKKLKEVKNVFLIVKCLLSWMRKLTMIQLFILGVIIYQWLLGEGQ